MNESWIKLFRKFREWEWYDDPITKSVWLEILLTANYEDKSWHGIDIKRGQLLTSIESLREGLKGKRKKCPISTHQVRVALNHLKTTNEVAIETTAHYTIITVIKYNEYQQVTNDTSNEWQTSGKRVATTKEIKNIRNKEDIIPKNKFFKKETVTEEVLVWVANKYDVPVDMVRVNWDRVVNWEPNAPRKIKDYRATLCTFVSKAKEQLLVKKKVGNNGKFVIANIQES